MDDNGQRSEGLKSDNDDGTRAVKGISSSLSRYTHAITVYAMNWLYGADGLSRVRQSSYSGSPKLAFWWRFLVVVIHAHFSLY